MDKGFTLVELVVVILVLGVLSAIALPRFLNASTEARLASLESLKGALLEGATLANTECRLLRGCDNSGFSSITITSPDGLSGQMYNGFPTSNASAFASHITRWVEVTGYSIDTSSVLFTDFESEGAADADNCKVRYNYAVTKAAGPVVEVVSSGC